IDAPCLMLIDRTPKWVNRYVKGTDPTQSPNGVSKFATMVIDKAARYQELDGQKLFEPVPACLMNWKAEVVQEYFLQSALMNLYYSNHGRRGCVEVFENNQGQSYEQFMGSPFLLLRDSLLY